MKAIALLDFGMTPYAYRTSSIGRERIHALDTLTTELDFHILVYKKNRS